MIISNKKFENDNICAVIISYNGSNAILKQSDILLNYVDHILIIDNASSEDTLQVLNNINDDRITIIYNNENKGLGYPLNQGIEFCLTNNIKWLISFDQDSIPEERMIEVLMANAKKYEKQNVASIAPQMVIGNSEINKSTDIIFKDTVITSGNLLNIKMIAHSGVRFNEDLFIDNVDFDFCLKLKLKGYKIIVCKEALLFHQLGTVRQVKLFFLRISIHHHSPFRHYYMMRNDIYMFKKYFFKFPYFIFKKIIYAFLKIGKILLFESDKIEIIKFTLMGLYDGVRGVYGKLN